MKPQDRPDLYPLQFKPKGLYQKGMTEMPCPLLHCKGTARIHLEDLNGAPTYICDGCGNEVRNPADIITK